MKVALATLAVLGVIAFAPAGAGAFAEVQVLAQPGSWLTTYTTPVVAVPVGGAAALQNLDLFRHNVVALDAYGASDQPWCGSFPVGRCPIFWSALVGTGGTAPVLGLDRLEATQTYTFYCTLHHVMEGTLVALPAP